MGENGGAKFEFLGLCSGFPGLEFYMHWSVFVCLVYY